MSRTIVKKFQAFCQSAGTGTLVHRTIGHPSLYDLDPFLLMDEFEISAEAAANHFPELPHRGFETVTYMIDGILHQRNTSGHQCDIKAGDIQWTTSGAGIIHSEIPSFRDGPVRGLQFWVNLPASEKMQRPRYQGFHAKNVPVASDQRVQIKIMAGDFFGLKGPIQDISVDPIFLDITFQDNAVVDLPLPEEHTGLLYTIEGMCAVQSETVDPRMLAILSEGDAVKVQGTAGSRVLVIAGAPLNEPVVRYGPIVMNTPEEVDEALEDLKEGRLDKVAS